MANAGILGSVWRSFSGGRLQLQHSPGGSSLQQDASAGMLEMQQHTRLHGYEDAAAPALGHQTTGRASAASSGDASRQTQRGLLPPLSATALAGRQGTPQRQMPLPSQTQQQGGEPDVLMLTPVPMPAVPRQTRQSKAAAGHHDARTQGEGGDFDAADAEDLERLDEDNQEEDEDDLPEDDTFFAWRQLVAPGSDIQQELTFVKYLSGGAKAANFLLMHEAAAYMGMPTSTVKSAVIRNKLDYILLKQEKAPRAFDALKRLKVVKPGVHMASIIRVSQFVRGVQHVKGHDAQKLAHVEALRKVQPPIASRYHPGNATTPDHPASQGHLPPAVVNNSGMPTPYLYAPANHPADRVRPGAASAGGQHQPPVRREGNASRGSRQEPTHGAAHRQVDANLVGRVVNHGRAGVSSSEDSDSDASCGYEDSEEEDDYDADSDDEEEDLPAVRKPIYPPRPPAPLPPPAYVTAAPAAKR